MTIQLQSVEVLDNPAPFTSEFKFRITFDCIAPGVKEELEWKLVYVGSADNEDNDQELDSILVGPVRVGKNRFTFTVNNIIQICPYYPYIRLLVTLIIIHILFNIGTASGSITYSSFRFIGCNSCFINLFI